MRNKGDIYAGQGVVRALVRESRKNRLESVIEALRMGFITEAAARERVEAIVDTPVIDIEV